MKIACIRSLQFFTPSCEKAVFTGAVILAYAGDWFFKSERWNSVKLGLYGFTAATLVDRSLRRMLTYPAKQEKFDISRSVIACVFMIGIAILEEGIYTGLLRTESTGWMTIPRFIVSAGIAKTAARALSSYDLTSHRITPDTKLGFLWACSREIFLRTLPLPINIKANLAMDTVLYGLNEVSPSSTLQTSLTRYSSDWIYKLISGIAFRSIANATASYGGFIAPLTQHLCFNFLTLLPE